MTTAGPGTSTEPSRDVTATLDASAGRYSPSSSGSAGSSTRRSSPESSQDRTVCGTGLGEGREHERDGGGVVRGGVGVPAAQHDAVRGLADEGHVRGRVAGAVGRHPHADLDGAGPAAHVDPEGGGLDQADVRPRPGRPAAARARPRARGRATARARRRAGRWRPRTWPGSRGAPAARSSGRRAPRGRPGRRPAPAGPGPSSSRTGRSRSATTRRPRLTQRPLRPCRTARTHEPERRLRRAPPGRRARRGQRELDREPDGGLPAAAGACAATSSRTPSSTARQSCRTVGSVGAAAGGEHEHEGAGVLAPVADRAGAGGADQRARRDRCARAPASSGTPALPRTTAEAKSEPSSRSCWTWVTRPSRTYACARCRVAASKVASSSSAATSPRPDRCPPRAPP